MNLILVVEDDAIVRLDVTEGLRVAFPEANIQSATLDDALSQINMCADLKRTALISRQMPDDAADLARLVSRGLCVIFTNKSLAEPARSLPAAVVDRPFDPATLISILSDCRLTERA